MKFIISEAKAGNFKILDNGNAQVGHFELEAGDFELVAAAAEGLGQGAERRKGLAAFAFASASACACAGPAVEGERRPGRLICIAARSSHSFCALPSEWKSTA